jgi:uncharacterized RDD family membrane protein YckC
MYCSKCGAVTGDGMAFCQVCGAPTGTMARPGGGFPIAGGAPGGLTYAHPVYAGFWLRFVAYLIDVLIVGIPVGVIFLVVVLGAGFGTAFGRIGEGNASDILPVLLGGAFLTILCFALVGIWLYFALCESSAWQATVGKRALGLVVTDYAGDRVTFGRASGRFFARFITGLLPFAIGYIMAGFTEKKQALHDMIAGCLVIRRA